MMKKPPAAVFSLAHLDYVFIKNKLFLYLFLAVSLSSLCHTFGMKIAKVLSAQTDCLTGQIIQVEVDISRGLHAFSIVGMADKAVAEAKDRIASAIKHSGYKSPKSRNEKVVISLAPAQLPKEGTGFDLAMAVGYLIATKELTVGETFGRTAEHILLIGELALDGAIRSIGGILPMIQAAKEAGVEAVFVSKENAREAAFVSGIAVYGAATLKQVILHIEDRQLLMRATPEKRSLEDSGATKRRSQPHNNKDISFNDIDGQEEAKRALIIALAGRHSLALVGPPGTGKTLLAKSSQSILPELGEHEAIEVMSLHSFDLSGKRKHLQPPFRAPHHSASYSAIIGGGTKQPIGEVSLAHKGVLFLDEFPEFDRRVVEALRQPMEEKVVRIARTEQRRELPADCIFIFAMNPCPCGYRGTKVRQCTCSQPMLRRYAEKISGPIIDRIDMWVKMDQNQHIFLTQRPASTLERKRHWEAGEIVLEKLRVTISMARLAEQQRNRGGDEAADPQIKPEAFAALVRRAEAARLSTRAFHRCLKLARTIADLEQSAWVEEKHILETLQYRVPPIDAP